METKSESKIVPSIEGWFTMDAREPHLIGSRCKSCGDYFFPKVSICRNPLCRGRELEESLLSRKGKIWSFTVNHYQPPAPYVPPTNPFVPYAVAAVELLPEKMIIQGQVTADCDFSKLRIGMDVELVLERLYVNEEGDEVVVWKWKPLN